MGGGVKNSALFIKYAVNDNNIAWSFAVSPQVYDVISRWGVSDHRVYVYDVSPARSIIARKKLKKLPIKLGVDVVFTMAGPAYVEFEVPHLMGISNGYLTHVDWRGFIVGRSFFRIFKDFLTVLYQTFYARKADKLLFQTEEARNGFCKRSFFQVNKTEIVANAIGHEFIEYFSNRDISVADFHNEKEIKVFCPASSYPHKALHLIPEIIKELKSLSSNLYSFRFILSLSEDEGYWKEILKKSKKLGVSKFIDTVGIYNYADAISLYEKSDIIFVPSILETFTISYIEAFASRKPLIVSNRAFAKEICGNAAIYIDPFNARSSAELFHKLLTSKEEQLNLCSNGLKILNNYGSQEARYKKIVSIVINLLDKSLATPS